MSSSGAIGLSARRVQVATGVVAAGGQADVTVPWPSAFPDVNYTVVATVEEGQLADTLKVLKVRWKTAADCGVRLANADALQGRSGVLNVVGIPG